MIDWSRVRELREEVGEEDFAEVVDLFMEEVEGVIGGLRHIRQEEAMLQALHFLKGSALSLGFAGFCDRCTAEEHRCAAHGLDNSALEVLIDSYTASRTVFLDEIEARIAA